MIPYLTIFFIFSIPQFFLEISLGQMYQKAGPQLYESLIGKKFKGLGIFSVMLAFLLSTFYNVLLAYSYTYFFYSFKSPLPWLNDDLSDQQNLNHVKSFFHDVVLQRGSLFDDPMCINWTIYFNFILSMIIVFFCIANGIKQSGKIAVFTASLPYIILVILLLRGFLLKGSWDGIMYLLTPKMDQLFNLSVWIDAISQVLFQYSVGYGTLMMFGSYQDKKQEILKMSLQIQFAVMLCGILSSLTVFIYLGHMSAMLNIDIESLPLSGPELTFIAYPIAITLMPFSNFWSILFFIMMITLGIDTQFGLVEVIAASVEDEKNFYHYFQVSNQVNRALITIVICIFGSMFCTNKGLDLMIIADTFSQGIPLISVIIFQTYIFVWYRDIEELNTDLKKWNFSEIPYLYTLSLKYIALPLCIFLMICSIPSVIMLSFSYPFWLFLFSQFFLLSPFSIAYYIYWKHKDQIPEIKQNLMNSQM